MSRFKDMAERAGRTRRTMERAAPAVTPERSIEDRRGRVVREAEWLNPGLGRKPMEGDR